MDLSVELEVEGRLKDYTKVFRWWVIRKRVQEEEKIYGHQGTGLVHLLGMQLLLSES